MGRIGPEPATLPPTLEDDGIEAIDLAVMVSDRAEQIVREMEMTVEARIGRPAIQLLLFQTIQRRLEWVIRQRVRSEHTARQLYKRPAALLRKRA